MNGLAAAAAVLGLSVLGLGLWVRLAPVEPSRWHVDPTRAPDPGQGGYRAGLDLPGTPEEVLARLDAIALATPRTIRIAGAPDEGRISWQTRSRLWGFPDYTTAQARPREGGTRLEILARLRFGKGDLGVNRTRVLGWIKALEHLEE